jgi:hypothetical protein
MIARRRTIKENMFPNQPANRGAFVKLKTHIEYAKEELHRLQGSENAALSNLEEIRLTIWL